MSVTIGTLENSVRTILLDTREGRYRWSSPVVFRGLRDGFKRLQSIRPESRYVGLKLNIFVFPSVDGEMTNEEIDSVRESSFQVDEKWHEAIIYYAVHKAYQLDDPDTANDSLSEKYHSLFERIAIT